MKLRGLRWPFVLLFLLGCGGVMVCWGAAPSQSNVIIPHQDPANQREFQNVYQVLNTKPNIYIGAGAPSFAPQKQGDIFISTSTSKVYISTDTLTSSSWAIVN